MKDKWADIGETKGAAAKLMKRRKRSGSPPFASDARARFAKGMKGLAFGPKQLNMHSGTASPSPLPSPPSSTTPVFLHSPSPASISRVSHQSLRPRWLDLHLIQLVSSISAVAENSAHLFEAAPSLDPR